MLVPGRQRIAGTPATAGTGDTWLQDYYRCDLTPQQVKAMSAGATVTPFRLPLPIPSPLEPTDADATTDRYVISQREGSSQMVHPDEGGPATIWGYDGQFPGPLIEATRGREVVVVQQNDLGVPVTVHLHGGHVPSDMDGHPNDLIPPGGSKEYRYHNDQPAATLWYHDHVHHETAINVYRGLAGMYVIRDAAEDGIGLPSGDFEVPLVVTDRTFQGSDDPKPGDLQPYTSRSNNGFLGKTHVVNGVAHPYLDVARARYRFRVLNACNSRNLALELSDGAAFRQIGTDGGLLPAPVQVTRLAVSPAERVEIVVDFGGYPPGTVLHLSDAIDEFGIADDRRLVEFRVGGDVPGGDTSTVPAALRDVPALGAASVTRDVTFEFDFDRSLWVIDGRAYDPDRIDQVVKLGATEVWRLHTADDSPMLHPVHLHFVMFQVLRRNGGPPRDTERGWKDTVQVGPGETVEVVARFAGHTGTYVYHCHNLEHEDNDMMAQLKVVDLPRLAGPGRVETAAAVSAAHFDAGVPVAFVATAETFPDALAVGPAAARVGAPVLLTGGSELHPATAAELQRLTPAAIVVLGGPRAVSGAVLDALRAYTAGAVSRLAGDDRYGTAAAISAAHFDPGVAVAYVCTGEDFPDALVGGAAAAREGGPMLLVARDGVPQATAAELQRLGPGRIVVLGGAAAVSRSTVDALGAYTSGPVTRLAGDDRYATAAATVAQVFPGAEQTVYVATGGDFPDALAAVPASAGAPLLIVARDTVPAAVQAQLERLGPQRIVLLGGAAAVSAEVEEDLALLLPD